MKRRRGRKSLLGKAMVIGVLTSILAGCGGAAAEHDQPAVDFNAVIDEAIASPGLNPETRELLESTRGRGELTFEEYRQGLNIFADCLADIGVEIEFIEVEDYGVKNFSSATRPLTGSDVDIDSVPAVSAVCEASSYFPLVSVYLSQQSSVQAGEQHLEKYRPALIDCIRSAGVEVEEDAPEFELVVEAAGEAYDVSGVDCVYDTGYAGGATIPTDWTWGG